MRDTVRLRLVVGHILPLVLIVALIAIALIYFSETQSLVPNLRSEVQTEALLAADLASDHPEIWSNPTLAQAFVARVDPYLDMQIMLLDPQGRILASTKPSGAALVGQVLQNPNLSQVFAGQISTVTDPSQDPHSDIVDVMVPVMTAQKSVLGIVRLTHPFELATERFARLRWIILGILASALVLGLGISLVLALTLERPLFAVTGAIYELVYGRMLHALPERGPRETRQLVRAFNTLVGRLAALEDSRRKLLANLVHELGTPLGALNSGLEALRGGADQDPPLRQELLMGMQAEIGELRRLTDDLAQLSSQIVGGFALHPRALDLDVWLPRVLAPWREATQSKGLHWNLASQTGLAPLFTDPDRLAQVLNNLISNAVKYTPLGGTVTVDAHGDTKGVRIRVSDTGPGIAPEEQDRIFEPFYRSPHVKRFSDGVGLGLAIARDLTRAQGGQLTVESQVGQGTTFSIWLPLAANAQAH